MTVERRIGSLPKFLYTHRPSGSAEPDKRGQMIKAEADLGERERVVDLLAFLPKGSDDKRFDLRIDHLPLEMLNPFLPDQYAEAHGELSGEVANYLTTRDIRTVRTLPYRGEIAFHQGEVYVPRMLILPLAVRSLGCPETWSRVSALIRP